MAATKGLSVLALEINDQLIEYKGNSLTFKAGFGDINVRHQTGGGDAGSKVITEDAETQIGMVKFSLLSTPANADRAAQWGLLSKQLNGNVIRLSGPGFTRNYRQMRLITDPEITSGSDADYELVFEGDPAT